jgi:predicted Zn finger-like uncharacterized protein
MTQTANTFHVDCPSCYTSFPVDPAKVPDGGVLARCSACEGVFRVQKPEDDFGTHPTSVAPAHEEMGTVTAPADDAASDEGYEAWGAEPAVDDSAGHVAEEPVVSEDVTADWTEGSAAVEEATADWTEGSAAVEEAPADWTEESAVEEGAVDWTEERAVEEGAVDFSEAPESLSGVGDDFSDDLGAATAPLADEAEPFSDAGAFDDSGALGLETPAAFGDTADSVMDQPVTWDDTPDAAAEAPHVVEDTADKGVDEAASFASAAADEPQVATDTAPAAAEPAPMVFGKRDPKEKAQRLARVLVSDMITYNKDRHTQALAQGTLVDDFEDEIKKSWAEYVDQVGEEIAEGTPYFTDALNEILAQGESVF